MSDTLGLPNEVRLADGLVVGGQPSADALRQAEENGIRAVVSLRRAQEDGFAEERAQVEAQGMRFIHIPVGGAGDLTEENARALDSAIGDAGPGATLVHCGSGNRVGALLALRAFYLQGKSPEEALQIGRDAGLTALDQAVQSRLNQAD